MKARYSFISIYLTLLLLLLSGCALSLFPKTRTVTGEYAVTFYQGDTVVIRQKVAEGESIPIVPVGVPWLTAEGALTDPAAASVYGRLDFYTQDVSFMTSRQRLFSPETDSAYSPGEPVTRGEIAAMVYSLLDEWTNVPVLTERAFTDLAQDEDAVEALAALNLLRGYGDGTFRPDQPMTRAELTDLLCRLSGAVGEAEGGVFADVSESYWAANSIALAAERGWIEGYDDGLFYPEAPITRAEAVTVLNRARNRQPNRAAIDTACDLQPYRDVPHSSWAYYDVVDASFENELLSYINGHAAEAEPGLVLLGENLCHINGDTLALDYYQEGFHTVDGALYYAPEDGYFLERFPAGLVEVDGAMYYVPEDDGPFLVDGEVGFLYFGEDGRYTSGSAIIDAYVDEFVASLDLSPSMTKYERLRAAYNKMRNGGYYFQGWKTLARGSTYWYQEAAEFFFQNSAGNCFNWAAGFMYVARRLGCQAYAVAGGEGSNNELHAWEVIRWSDGKEYVCDVELEWAFRNGHIGGQAYYFDLFMMPRGSLSLPYFFP